MKAVRLDPDVATALHNHRQCDRSGLAGGMMRATVD